MKSLLYLKFIILCYCVLKCSASITPEPRFLTGIVNDIACATGSFLGNIPNMAQNFVTGLFGGNNLNGNYPKKPYNLKKCLNYLSFIDSNKFF